MCVAQPWLDSWRGVCFPVCVFVCVWTGEQATLFGPTSGLKHCNWNKQIHPCHTVSCAQIPADPLKLTSLCWRRDSSWSSDHMLLSWDHTILCASVVCLCVCVGVCTECIKKRTFSGKPQFTVSGILLDIWCWIGSRMVTVRKVMCKTAQTWNWAVIRSWHYMIKRTRFSSKEIDGLFRNAVKLWRFEHFPTFLDKKRWDGVFGVKLNNHYSIDFRDVREVKWVHTCSFWL